MNREPLISKKTAQWLLRLAGLLIFAFIIWIYIDSDDGNRDIDGCKKFQLGTFTYYPTLESKEKIITIGSEFHIERNNKDSSFVKSKINWFTNCHFRLEVVESKGHEDVYKGDVMEVKFDHTIADTCFFIRKRDGQFKKGRLVKIN